jgi:hypothetical protein
VQDLGITTIGSALRMSDVRVDQVGDDARITGRLARDRAAGGD